MNFKLTVLGNNSAIPCFGRHPSAQILTIHNELMLIDCGEGTQLLLEEYGIKKMKINYVFISHLHGDHIFGLPGLLTTFSLLHREHPLTIYGPQGLEEMIMGFLGLARARFNFQVEFIVVEPKEKELIFENEYVKAFSFPLNHGIPTNGYLFVENLTKLKLRIAALEKYKILPEDRHAIAMGENYVLPSGKIISNELLTYPPRKPISYAYCSDNATFLELTLWVRGVTLLYHETTYMSDMELKAKERFHSTTTQAAELAKTARVDYLIIGHFSSRYRSLEPLLAECKSVFPNTILSVEGRIIDLHDL